jgi:hypothetical protein
MRKIIGFQLTLILTIILLSVYIYNQEKFDQETIDRETSDREKSMAAPPEHKKKVYVDQKEKNIYWPMNKSFWVRLTTSPDENAPSYLLQKVHPKSIATAEQYMKDGINLEINGRQFIRWYNVVTDEFIFLKFFADGEPPDVTETLSGAPIYVSPKNDGSGEDVYYGKGLKCSIDATDKTSGVEGVFYSIDGEEFKSYSTELVFDAEKKVNLRYYSVDRVGYASEPVTVRFTVDHSSPVTAHDVRTNFSGDVLSPSSTIRLSSVDQLSGLKETYFLLDDQTEHTVYSGKDIEMDALADGEHRLLYYSVDQVENLEARTRYQFYLDRIPPVSGSRFLGDHYSDGGIDYISPRTRIELTSTDNKIGVRRIEYSFIDGYKALDKSGDFKNEITTGKSKKNKKEKNTGDGKTGSFQTYGEPFKTPFKSGEHAVVYRAIDRLDNLSENTVLPVRMDDTPPRSSKTLKGAKFEQRDTIWITRDTRVILSAGDDAAGVRGIYFQLGQKAEYVPYSEPIAIPEEGRYLFKFYSADNVDNRETEQPYIIIVDNSPPTVMKTFSVPSTGTETGDDGSEINVYPRYTSLFFGAVDNSSGIAWIRYSINGAKEDVYSTPLMFNEEGKFSMAIKLRDNVGNTRTESLQFVIKD